MYNTNTINYSNSISTIDYEFWHDDIFSVNCLEIFPFFIHLFVAIDRLTPKHAFRVSLEYRVLPRQISLFGISVSSLRHNFRMSVVQASVLPCLLSNYFSLLNMSFAIWEMNWHFSGEISILRTSVSKFRMRLCRYISLSYSHSNFYNFYVLRYARVWIVLTCIFYRELKLINFSFTVLVWFLNLPQSSRIILRYLTVSLRHMLLFSSLG